MALPPLSLLPRHPWRPCVIFDSTAAWLTLLLLTCWNVCLGCQQRVEHEQQRSAPLSTSARALESNASKDAHSQHDCSEHEERPASTGSSATALSDEVRNELTQLRVSAHVGSVTIRKRQEGWVLAGKRGCTVAPRRITDALDNLASLSASATRHSLPVGTEFELQIDALVGEKRALHFEVARLEGDDDLVRLPDDSVVSLAGLDRELWVPDPAAWCKDP